MRARVVVGEHVRGPRLGVAARLREPLDAAARRHAEAGAADVLSDDYAGSHWLSSFALYLLTRAEGGIAPGGG